ncbi:GNAT family N-acetyltransferase [Streptomyces bohaiensis]|uniref:GNAT family N-acetyltransferase n=1 Tax=Streptomyces bohaiensis TaxID=1431344 RepID=A0ABX1CA00_9ACTN|nr:GNAT family N-acetyltransferase [Streptomyces bohaiensis]NJQ13959.1 GNAT family N-acetyltransferase [Streptomyces bohaiensis]
MSIQYSVDPEVTPELTDGLLRLWADVTNAGGAVGYVPPVVPEEIREVCAGHLAQVAAGEAHLVLGTDAAGDPAALAFVHRNSHRLMRHWVGLYRVMVHPSLQGTGEGRRLMAACEETARSAEGIRAIRLTCRGGLGLERFYESCGYKEVGRTPEAIRVAADDFRDDVLFWRPLA